MTAHEEADTLVPALLGEYGNLTRVALCDYLGPRAPERHLYNLVADYPRRGGRMLRPSLCIATARAFGASAADAVRSAVALELLHNAFLVHDDIEDESDSRRGRPTLHALHGVAVALNVGDALAFLGIQALIDNRRTLGSQLTMSILEEAERMARESIEGQALELGWRRDNTLCLSDADYLTMVLKKTCWLTTIHPLRVGCLIGTRGRGNLDPLIRLGFFFGAAFQIQDDLLNLQSSAGYGKELNGDLLEGKRTLMLIYAMRTGRASERARLTRLLAKPRYKRSARDVAWMRSLIDRTGAVDHARSVAKGLAGAALYEFEQIFDEATTSASRDAQFIRNMITWVLQRDT